MARSVSIALGGRQYEVKALPIKASRAWRERFNGPMGQVLEIFNVSQIELNSPADLGRLLGSLKDILLGSLDLAADLLFSYSPALAADRERIEAEAFDEEMVAALIEVVKLAFPFGEFVKLARGLQSRATLTSSPAPSGASGPTS
jgi:hypothetical protein